MEEFDDAMDAMETNSNSGVPNIMGATVTQSIITTNNDYVPAFEERHHQEIKEESPTNIEKELEKVLEKAQPGSAV